MAIRLEDEYINADPASASYPGGSFKNETISGLKDGTPFEKAWPNNFLGFFEKLLDYANITPSGIPDTVVASDYFNGLLFALSNTYSALKDYVVNERSIGSDGNRYKALIANGPSTSVVNPVGDNTGTWKIEKDVKISSFKGLTGSRTSVSIVSYDIDEVILTDDDGYPLKLTGLTSKTADITVSGAGGLDTGSEANSTWYYVWLVAKPDGTNTLIFSLSSTSPTMPSEYVYKCLVSSVYNNSSGDIVDFIQNENNISISPTTIVSGGIATTPTLVNISNVIPVGCKAIRGDYYITDGGGGNVALTIGPTSGSIGRKNVSGVSNTSPYSIGGEYCVDIKESQSVYYFVSSGDNSTIKISEYTI